VIYIPLTDRDQNLMTTVKQTDTTDSKVANKQFPLWKIKRVKYRN